MSAALSLRPIDRTEVAFAQVAAWRRAFFHVETDFEAALCDWFGLRAGEARILAVLYHSPRPTRPEALTDAAGVTSKTLSLYLSAIRDVLGDGCLPRAERDGAGYQLTKLGRSQIERAVEEAGLERLRRDLSGAAA